MDLAPKVKLRLGRFGVNGEQKGVDVRMGLDMVAHARNGASDVFILVSGDDDLTEAVEGAQAHGVEVIVLAVPNADGQAHGVSRHLLLAADELRLVAPETIDGAVLKREPVLVAPSEVAAPVAETPMHPTPKDLASQMRQTGRGSFPTPVATSSSGGGVHVSPGYGDPADFDEQIDAVVANILGAVRDTATPESRLALEGGRPSIPREIDRALLTDLSEALSVNDLSDPIRFRLRERFWKKYDDEPPRP